QEVTCSTIHVITGALKLFLRELPEPLFPFSLTPHLKQLCVHFPAEVPDYSMRVSYMKDLVRTLPLPNHDTMELVFIHPPPLSLPRVIEHKDSNRMSVQSVAIVFGPTLLRPQTESANMTIHMVFQSQIVEFILESKCLSSLLTEIVKSPSELNKQHLHTSNEQSLGFGLTPLNRNTLWVYVCGRTCGHYVNLPGCQRN
uniref:Rho GTPase activating protein 27, like n=1 Tax=Seriola lalandi dorsalis TaxID=1841481 RepID=A0A3B4WWJ7_SERLL